MVQETATPGPRLRLRSPDVTWYGSLEPGSVPPGKRMEAVGHEDDDVLSPSSGRPDRDACAPWLSSPQGGPCLSRLALVTSARGHCLSPNGGHRLDVGVVLGITRLRELWRLLSHRRLDSAHWLCGAQVIRVLRLRHSRCGRRQQGTYLCPSDFHRLAQVKWLWRPWNFRHIGSTIVHVKGHGDDRRCG